MNVIEASNLTKEFSSAKEFHTFLFHPFRRSKSILAINQINLKIPEGKVFTLLGPNGAGKTTLIKMLCSLILPTRGTAKVCGYDIIQEEKQVKKSVGLVSGEERSFYWRLTGRENLSFFAALYGLSPGEVEHKINFLSRFLLLKDYLDKRFQEYSTGMKQRLSIARCLLNDPKILFLDEPTKSLDPEAREKLHHFILRKLVKEEGKTIFYTTHQMDEAEYFSDCTAIMVKGQIKISGTKEELYQGFSKRKISTLKDLYNHFVSDN